MLQYFSQEHNLQSKNQIFHWVELNNWSHSHGACSLITNLIVNDIWERNLLIPCQRVEIFDTEAQ